MEQNILLKSSPWDKDNLKRSPEKTKKEPQGRVGGTKTKLMQAWSTISLKARRVFTCQGHTDEKHVDYNIHIKGQNICTVRYSFASWGFEWDWTGGWLFQLVQPCQGGCRQVCAAVHRATMSQVHNFNQYLVFKLFCSSHKKVWAFQSFVQIENAK